MEKIYIKPHIVFRLHGRLFILCYCILAPMMFLDTIRATWNDPDIIALKVVFYVWAVLMMLVSCWLFRLAWNRCFCKLIITDDTITYCGLLLRQIELRFTDIRYVQIRASHEERYSDPNSSPFLILVLSYNPIPQKPISKIRASKKQELIRFDIGKKLLYALETRLPSRLQGCISEEIAKYRKLDKKKALRKQKRRKRKTQN